MPHDKNGNELKTGDWVNVPCEILQVSQNDTACNVTVKARLLPLGGEYMPVVCMNTRQVELVEQEPVMVTAGLLDLLKYLKQLKDLVGSEYFGELKDIALAALDQDWRAVHHLTFVLGEKWTADLLWPKVKLAVMPDPAIYTAMMEAFDAMADATMVSMADGQAIDPATWLLIIRGVLELIKFIKDRNKK